MGNTVPVHKESPASLAAELAVADFPTEPMPDPVPNPAIAPRGTPPPLHTVFDHNRFQFTSGIPSGEKASIRDRRGAVLLTYRSFASVVGIVAALVASVVLIAGVAAVLFLIMEGRLLPALAAIVLSGGFAAGIVLLEPPSRVTLYENSQPALTVVQQPGFSFPSVTWLVQIPNGPVLGRIRRSFFSRLGRQRWTLLGPTNAGPSGVAVEESLGRALQRKLAGNFSPRYQSNLRIRYAGSEVGTIQRRPSRDGARDLLELGQNSPLDRRIAVALATLVLGSEP